MIKINLYNLLLKIKSDAELKLGKLGFNFDYSKLTNFAIHPYYKEKRVVTYTIITFEEHNKE